MTSTADEPVYRIGEVARRAGVTPRTIRYYEELGLLSAAGGRAKGDHRQYSEGDVARLAEIVRLRDLLGLSLEELAALAEAEEARSCLRARWADSTDDAERGRILRTSIPLVEQQLELLRARRQRLDEFFAELEAKLDLMRRRLAELDG